MLWIQPLGRTAALARRGIRPVAPNSPAAPERCRRYGVDDDRLWECLALATAASGFHYVGTCGIGAVVDDQLRVRGAAGLRVVDASAIPVSPSGNTNAPVIMLAEKAACMLRRDHDQLYRPPPGEVC